MHTQKYPSIRHNVTPMMTGNLYDFNFDGQGTIMSDMTAPVRRGGFVGQWPRPGFADHRHFGQPLRVWATP